MSFSLRSSPDHEYHFICSSLGYIKFGINIVCNYVLPLFSMHICLCILIIRIYPCLYFLGVKFISFCVLVSVSLQLFLNSINIYLFSGSWQLLIQNILYINQLMQDTLFTYKQPYDLKISYYFVLNEQPIYNFLCNNLQMCLSYLLSYLFLNISLHAHDSSLTYHCRNPQIYSIIT